MAISSWADGAVDETIGSGQERTDLPTWEAAHDGETPTNGTNCKGSITGDVTSGIAYFSGWQSGQNATTKMVLTAQAGDEPDGITDATGSKALISNNINPYDSGVEYHFDFFLLEFTGRVLLTPGSNSVYSFGRTVHRDVADDIIRTTGSNTHTVNIGASIIKNGTDAHDSGIDAGGSGATFNLVNVTIAGMDGTGSEGIKQTSGTVNLKNGALANNTADISGTVGTTTTGSEDGHGDFTITHNDSDDFNEPSTGDYTVFPGGGSALDGAGTAEAASWFTDLCPTDFTGTAWATPPSVGCFEIVAAGGVEVSAIANTINHNGLGPMTFSAGRLQ